MIRWVRSAALIISYLHHHSCYVTVTCDAFVVVTPTTGNTEPKNRPNLEFQRLAVDRRRQPRTTYFSSILSSSSSPSSPSAAALSNEDTKLRQLPTRGPDAIIKERLLALLMTSSNNQSLMNDSYGPVEVAAYQLFRSLRDLSSETPLLGMTGHPFVLRRSELESVWHHQQQTPPPSFVNFFTMDDLQLALTDDFLDAARGSTDPRSGWKITDVSVPRGDSFEEARMTYTDVCDALEKGTVIFNAAGAHIPKLAGICLAACDATSLPCALNMYITASGKRTSAPPHTDKQDVCVIQTQGCKAWKVFAIPDPSIKPNSDIFARGKAEDNLPLHALKETSEILLETTIYPGDILFIPAGFPHTTSTIAEAANDEIVVAHSGKHDETSVHLTLGIDHHIWELDYLSVIRLAYRRAGRTDNPLWDNIHDTSISPCVGKVNMLSLDIVHAVMAELPLGLLDSDDKLIADSVVRKTADILAVVDPGCNIDSITIRETVDRIRQQGIELLEIHCDMYTSAMQEGRTRDAETAMTEHLGVDSTIAKAMSPDRIRRLSLFRVKKYYDLINDSIDRLKIWSLAGVSPAMGDESPIESQSTIDSTTSNLISVGDKVDAELGGAFFPATVTKISEDGSYDVTFFDGDKEFGLKGDQIRNSSVPKSIPTMDTSKMTTKQLKRWKKQQEKQ